MLLVNKITKPGGIRRIELHADVVRVVLQNGTVRVYRSGDLHHEVGHGDKAGYLGALLGAKES